MTEHEGFPNERSADEQTTERHGDTWVAGSGSVVAPEGGPPKTESPEGGADWEHHADHAPDTSEAGQVSDRPWEVSPAATEHSGTEHGGTAEGDFGPAEADLGAADHGTPDDLGPGDYGTAEDADTADRGAAEAEPEAATASGSGTGAPPAAGTTGEQIEHLIDPAESARFRASWREIQSGFVDDPKDAVHQAGTLTEEVLNALSAALNARMRAVDEGWQGGDQQADTERLRIALRGYRALLDQVLAG